MKKYKIDEELKNIMPHLTKEEYEELEQSLLTDGYKGSPIIIWNDTVIDGHNRYEICLKHDIPFEVKELEFPNKEEVIHWMVRAQLGRRNLSPIQRIAITEKYRPIYEKQAKENQAKYYGNQYEKKNGLTENLPQVQSKKERNPTTDKRLSDVAGVSEKTYRMGAKILNSDNEDLKQRVLSGETAISAGYKEMRTQEISNVVVSNELIQIQKRYNNYLNVFGEDIGWLLEKEYLKNDEDITGKIHSDLKNCLEKFKSIKTLVDNLTVDMLDENTIII